ncbi:MAG: hypothetical protein AB8U44_04200 [Aaplasma endosymbiont of Hyalomma asiaticum]
MKSEPRHRTDTGNKAVSSEPNKDYGATRFQTTEQQERANIGEQLVLSAEEIENVIKCIEEEYGSELTDSIKKAMREEISTAVPELTKALVPLIMEAGKGGTEAGKLQQDWIKIFMEVMLPHMQKIVASTQQ